MSLILSIFPGLDLLGRAFEGFGHCVVHGPDVLWGGDVRVFHPPPGRFDGVIGGPPCQSFSPLANLVRARGYEPRFGNLIPEFERCIAEAALRWFLMEEVPQAPVPVVEGYAVSDFVLRNEHLAGEDGLGMEQERAGVRVRQLSPWDCPHCGRLSASEPTFERRPTCHHIVEDPPRSKLFAVHCWYCGTRGPLSGSAREAIQRWQHLAARNGVPAW